MQVETSPNQYYKKFRIPIAHSHDPKNQLYLTIRDSIKILRSEVSRGIKINVILKVSFEKLNLQEDDSIHKSTFFQSKALIIMNEFDIDDALHEAFDEVLNRISNWMSEGSGWRIGSVDEHYINIYKYSPLAASSYLDLPKELQNPKKGLINIRNSDMECFRWCHLAYKFPVERDPQRVSKYKKKHIDKLNYTGIEFPVTINQIPKIEKQNNISFNIFGYEDDSSAN